MTAAEHAATASQNIAILKQLIESLEGLVEAVDLIAKFVTLMEDELKSISRVGVGEEMKKAHFIKLQGKGRTLVECCKGFIAIEPSISSDIGSIKQQLDEDYIRQWHGGLKTLSKQLQIEA
jgi:hypothetical protein